MTPLLTPFMTKISFIAALLTVSATLAYTKPSTSLPKTQDFICSAVWPELKWNDWRIRLDYIVSSRGVRTTGPVRTEVKYADSDSVFIVASFSVRNESRHGMAFVPQTP
jgi:hypothetical protein